MKIIRSGAACPFWTLCYKNSKYQPTKLVRIKSQLLGILRYFTGVTCVKSSIFKMLLECQLYHLSHWCFEGIKTPWWSLLTNCYIIICIYQKIYDIACWIFIFFFYLCLCYKFSSPDQFFHIILYTSVFHVICYFFIASLNHHLSSRYAWNFSRKISSFGYLNRESK